MGLFGKSLVEAGRSLERLGARLQGRLTAEGCQHARITPLGASVPVVGNGAFVAPSASIIGNVEIGQNSAIWYNAVLRGDVNNIKIGSNTSIGDRAVIHVTKTHPQGMEAPSVIGDNVNVGAGA